MKIKAKIVSTIMALTVTASTMVAINASAVLRPGDYAGYDNARSVSAQTQFMAELSWPNLTNKVCWSGGSCTSWNDWSSYNADSIKHTNYVRVAGVGSLSVGTDSAGMSIDEDTASEAYEVQNDWCLNVDFNYNLKRGIFIWGTDFTSSGSIQVGHNVYKMSCMT